jgi:hypothetical protein
LLPGACEALAALRLEELAVRGRVYFLLRRLPSTLHTLRIAQIHHDLTFDDLSLLNLSGLRRLTLQAAGKNRTIRLRDLAAANQLEILRLGGFIVNTEQETPSQDGHVLLRLPANVRSASFCGCTIRTAEVREPSFSLSGNPNLESFTLEGAAGPVVSSNLLSFLTPSLRELVLGPACLTAHFFERLDLSSLWSLTLTAIFIDGFLPPALYRPVNSLTRLAIHGPSLNAAWWEYLLGMFPNVRDLTCNLLCSGDLRPNFRKVLGQLRSLALQLGLAPRTLVDSVLAATGPELRVLCITGSLEQGHLEDLVLPAEARLTSLQMGARVYWQRAAKVMSVDFITREIETELGH